MASQALTTPYTSYPTGAPSTLVDPTNYVRLKGPGNRVEVAIKCTVGTGTAYLLRWDADAEAWMPWDSVALAAATAGGMALLLATVDDACGDWTLFVTGGPTLTVHRLRARTVQS